MFSKFKQRTLDMFSKIKHTPAMETQELFQRIDTFGKRARVCRFYFNEPTQNIFARKHNLQPSVLSMVERGRRTPSDEMLITLCRVFDVGPSFLLKGENPPAWWNPRDLEDTLQRMDAVDNKRRSNMLAFTRRPPAPAEYGAPPQQKILHHEFEQLTLYYIEAPSQLRELVRYLLTSNSSHLSSDEWDDLTTYLTRRF
jgi:transcriptional regulator with XRE-family HTH domain